MRNTRKILVALLLVFVMLMSFATVSAFAADEADTRTIYFTNNKGWSKVNAYCWSSNSTPVKWPGAEMTKHSTNDYGEDIYAIEIPADMQNIIFNNGSEQTVDITLNPAVNAYYITEQTNGKWKVGTWTFNPDGCTHTPAGEATASVPATCTKDGEDTFTCANCSESYTVVTMATGHKYENGKCTVCQAVPTFTVAGVEALCGTGWDTGNTANDMTYDEAAGTYTKVYENLPAGTYAFKCVQDHTWNPSYGGVGETADKDGNYVVTLTGESNTLTITLNGDTISVKVEEYLDPDDPTVDPDDPTVDPDDPTVDPDDPTVDPDDPTDDPTDDPAPEAPDYYLIGYINGANYGCDTDWENLGDYKFVDGKLTATFTGETYVFVKTGDNQNWYMTDGWLGTEVTGAVLGTTYGENSNKLHVPVGVEVTFTLVDNGDGTLTLSYETAGGDQPGTDTPGTDTPVETTPTFTIAGTGAHLGTEWDTANTANDMTYADGVYTKVYTNVKAGEYAFKCAKDHKWDVAYPAEDYKYTVEVDGSTVTITLDGETVTVEIEAPEAPKPDDTNKPGDTTKPDDSQKPGDNTPEQPEQELDFFEAIWQAILDFFKSIGDFFAGLFGGSEE